jgi:hypothetical protein
LACCSNSVPSSRLRRHDIRLIDRRPLAQRLVGLNG